LERHLVISDQAYTMAKLKEMSNDTIYLTAARDSLKLRVREQSESEYTRFVAAWRVLAFAYTDILTSPQGVGVVLQIFIRLTRKTARNLVRV